MIKRKGFEMIISSDIQYEELCAEIYFDGEFVAIVTQEQGIENAIIEIDPPKNLPNWRFNYSGFIRILEDAYSILEEMKKKS